jgi:hypothetical protein
MKENTKKPTLSSDKHGDSVLLRGKFKPNGLGSFIEMVVQSSKLILCNCDPCSKHAPIDESGASRGNKPTILFPNLAVAVSVHVTLLSHHLISHYAACSH